MFSHVNVGITDFARSYGFYSAVLGELGLEVKIYRPEQSWAGWGAAGAGADQRIPTYTPDCRLPAYRERITTPGNAALVCRNSSRIESGARNAVRLGDNSTIDLLCWLYHCHRCRVDLRSLK